MHIMIDIPEAYYEALRKTDVIVSGQRSGKTLLSVIYNAIANGIQLPKGHGDLIDRSKLDADYCTFDYKKPEFVGYSVGLIENAEVIIPADKEGAE